MAISSRIEGATLRGYRAVLVDETNTPITDGLDYTWTVEVSTQLTPGVQADAIWIKTTGITPTTTGFDLAWESDDVGALTATDHRKAAYTVEFTGVASGDRIIKFQESLQIEPEVS